MKSKEEREAELALRQKECREKMVAEGRHVYNPNRKFRGKDEPISDWIVKALKSIRKRQKKQAQVVTSITSRSRKMK